MMSTTSAARAAQVLQELLAGGVREVVLAPGSRSAPLALALYAADAAGDLRLHVRIDERTAGFLALGLSMGSRRPVAVVTTSGTAVGNLLPAVMEAHHAGRQVVVVSADRPASLRGTGANQTTWQDGIFGVFAATIDLALDATPGEVTTGVAAALRHDGPGHLNVQFDTPLLPEPGAPWWPGPLPVTGDPATDDPRGRSVDAAVAAPAPRLTLEAGPRTVVLAGDDAGPAARMLAEAAGVPLLAEPSSGSRAGDRAIRSYRLLLATALGAAIERVIVVGHPTLSRPISALLSRTDVDLYAVRTRTGVATDPAHRATVLDSVPMPTGPTGFDTDHGWFAAWRSADDELSSRIDRFVDERPDLDALQVAAEISRALGPGQSLVVGSSNPIRDLDLMLVPYRPRQRRLVVANRGLAGIDGTVSTAIGVDLGRAGAPRTLAVMGDVTFLHDASALVMGPDEPRPVLTIVVVNDDGGSIFALLEQGGPDYAPAFERVFATPHRTDLAALVGAGHAAYRLAESRRALRELLAAPTQGPLVVEARVDRADRRATAAALAGLASGLPIVWPPVRGAR